MAVLFNYLSRKLSSWGAVSSTIASMEKKSFLHLFQRSVKPAPSDQKIFNVRLEPEVEEALKNSPSIQELFNGPKHIDGDVMRLVQLPSKKIRWK